jgi:hypothetical protein
MRMPKLIDEINEPTANHPGHTVGSQYVPPDVDMSSIGLGDSGCIFAR